MRETGNDTKAVRCRIPCMKEGGPSAGAVRNAHTTNTETGLDARSELLWASTLGCNGIDNTHFEAMAEHIEKHWFAPLEAFPVPFSRKDVVEVLKRSL